MNTFICIVNWTWGILQTLIGLIVKLIFIKYGHSKESTKKYGDVYFCYWPYSSGVSLGNFRFVPKYADEDFRSHEMGHSVQSAILGPFYLLSVGWFSLLLAAGIIHKDGMQYHDWWCEKWADKLGGAYGQ